MSRGILSCLRNETREEASEERLGCVTVSLIAFVWKVEAVVISNDSLRFWGN